MPSLLFKMGAVAFAVGYLSQEKRFTSTMSMVGTYVVFCVRTATPVSWADLKVMNGLSSLPTTSVTRPRLEP